MAVRATGRHGPVTSPGATRGAGSGRRGAASGSSEGEAEGEGEAAEGRVPVAGEDGLWAFGQYVMSPPSSEAQRVALTSHERPGFLLALWAVTALGCVGIVVGAEALARRDAALRKEIQARDEAREVLWTRSRMEAVGRMEAAEAKGPQGAARAAQRGVAWDEARVRAVVREAVHEGVAGLHARVEALEGEAKRRGGAEPEARTRTWAQWAAAAGRRPADVSAPRDNAPG